MERLLGAMGTIIYWIYFCATIIPVYHVVTNTIHIPIVNILLVGVVTSIPLVNFVVGIIGAIDLWNFTIVQAILFYLAPALLPIIFFTICFCYEKICEVINKK